MYIRNVITAAAIDGIQTEINLFFPKRNEPIKTPTVTPKRIKNTVISVADKGETRIFPSLQNAVKQARIHSPRKESEQTDCKTKDFKRLFLPVFIILPNPYRQLRMERISTTDII
jgi:hypothetical protein